MLPPENVFGNEGWADLASNTRYALNPYLGRLLLLPIKSGVAAIGVGTVHHSRHLTLLSCQILGTAYAVPRSRSAHSCDVVKAVMKSSQAVAAALRGCFHSTTDGGSNSRTRVIPG